MCNMHYIHFSLHWLPIFLNWDPLVYVVIACCLPRLRYMYLNNPPFYEKNLNNNKNINKSRFPRFPTWWKITIVVSFVLIWVEDLKITCKSSQRLWSECLGGDISIQKHITHLLGDDLSEGSQFNHARLMWLTIHAVWQLCGTPTITNSI